MKELLLDQAGKECELQAMTGISRTKRASEGGRRLLPWHGNLGKALRFEFKAVDFICVVCIAVLIYTGGPGGG